MESPKITQKRSTVLLKQSKVEKKYAISVISSGRYRIGSSASLKFCITASQVVMQLSTSNGGSKIIAQDIFSCHDNFTELRNEKFAKTEQW